MNDRTGLEELDAARENRRSRQKAFYIILVLVLAFIVAVALFRFFFRVEKITAEGSTRYSFEDIVNDSGIVKGQSMFFISESKVQERLKSKYPYIEKVTVDRKMPSGVKITVEERSVMAYIGVNGELFALSEDMYVLDRITENDLHDGLIKINASVSNLRKAVVGELLEFFDPKTSKCIFTLLETLDENGVKDQVSSINADNRFSLSMRYGDRFTVYLGSIEDIEIKIPFLIGIIESLGKTDKGKIDVSSAENATFSPEK